MFESKHSRVPAEEKHTRSSHALVDRTLLKSMQNDITHASELISALRDEKEKLRKSIQHLQQDNHEKNNIIRSLRNKIKHMEAVEEDDEMMKELNKANIKLKNEIELSLQGIVHKPSDTTSEIISLTESFLNIVHSKAHHYQIFKSHMKSSNHFKQTIGNENWAQSTLLLLRFIKDVFPAEDFKVKTTCPDQLSDEESEQENYTKIIQDSKHLLDTLNYQKSKLENLNQEFATRGTKLSPTVSPLYRGNAAANLTGSSDGRKESSQIANFSTANKLAKNVTSSKIFRKNKPLN